MKSLVIGLVLLFSACGNVPVTPRSSVNGLPPEAEKAVLTFAAKESGKDHYREYKDFRLQCFERVSVTPADQANGVEEKWCVEVGSIIRLKDPSNSPWQNLLMPLTAQKASGTWKIDWKQAPAACACREH